MSSSLWAKTLDFAIFIEAMSAKTVITNARVINEGKITQTNILIEDKYIADSNYQGTTSGCKIIDASGLHLIPGIIDSQVHFRDPGLSHKGDLYTESRAALAGGVTSFFEMPNTVPNVLTQELLAAKYELAASKSWANYSFYMGTSNSNTDEVLRTDPKSNCGIKIFLGASTGNMLVDKPETLEHIFANASLPIALHCEDEPTIRKNAAAYKERYGEEIPLECHPLIRSEEACYKSTEFATTLARKHKTRIHILHLSTAREIELLDKGKPGEKLITAEVCAHHLWFSDQDYAERGARIKWNPAIKTAADRAGLWQALLDDRIDVIATDHAPHTLEEKNNSYFKCPSGGPLVQHSLLSLLEHHKQGRISLERVVEKMCHAPADCFKISKRGYIREGYYADLALIDLKAKAWQVNTGNILYKCGWSPFEGMNFSSAVTHTIVNGELSYQLIDGEHKFSNTKASERISFAR